MSEMAKHGGLIGLHCENADLIECTIAQLLSEGKIESIYHARSRPPLFEAEAVQKAIRLAEIAGCPMYTYICLLHGLNEFIEAKRKGFPAYAETCPHNLTLTDKEYFKPNGERYIMSPPLRTKEDMDSMWFSLANECISTVGSDHCLYLKAEEAAGFQQGVK